MEEHVGTMLPQIGVTNDTIPVKNALFNDKLNAKIKKHENEKGSITIESLQEKKEAETLKPKKKLVYEMADREIKYHLDKAADSLPESAYVSDSAKRLIVDYRYNNLIAQRILHEEGYNNPQYKKIMKLNQKLQENFKKILSSADQRLVISYLKIDEAVAKACDEIKREYKTESDGLLYFDDPYFEAADYSNTIKIGKVVFHSNVDNNGIGGFITPIKTTTVEAMKSLAEASKYVNGLFEKLKGEGINKKALKRGQSYNFINVRGNKAIIIINDAIYNYTTDLSNIVEFTKYLHLIRKIYFTAKKEMKIPNVQVAMATNKPLKTGGNGEAKQASCSLTIIYKNKINMNETEIKESGDPKLSIEDELEKCKKQLAEVDKKLSGNDYTTADEKRKKGLEAHIKRLEKEINKKVEKDVKESADQVFTEAKKLDPAIKKIVDAFESKGYLVKYASPGHNKLRKKEDKDSNGVYNGKLYSDARVMFADDYEFPAAAPRYWHWRMVDNKDYLDISPINYNKDDGTPDEAFKKWKTNYLKSLSDFAKSLEPAKHNVREPKEEEKKESVMDENALEAYLEKAFSKYNVSILTPEERLANIESELFGE